MLSVLEVLDAKTIAFLIFSWKMSLPSLKLMNVGMQEETKEVLSRFCFQDQSFPGSGIRLVVLLDDLLTAPCASNVKGQWLMDFSFGIPP